jgi:hypothetical protein
MENLISCVLSCLFISIPETIFMVILLIRFSGRKELLDPYRFKDNFKWYVILIIPPSILMDILNYGLKIRPKSISTIICLLLLYVLSIYVFKKTDYEQKNLLFIKILLLFIPLFISLIVIDLLTAPVWFYLLGLTYNEISSNIYLVLLCSISSRIIEFLIIVYILIHKNSKFQINVLQYVYKNNYFKRISLLTLIGLLVFEMYVLKLISVNNLLNIFDTLTEQIVFIICFTYLAPSFILFTIYLMINYSANVINSVERDQKSNNVD